MKGIDVSAYQGVVPWHNLSEIGFGITKVSEGEGYSNPYWQSNAVNMRVEKKTRGFYHFSMPAWKQNTPEGEAAYFWSKIENVLMKGDLIAVDIEKAFIDDPVVVNSWALRVLSHLEYLAGWPPFLYSYPDFITRYLTDKRLARFPLWLAWYQEELPKSYRQWKTITLWQQGPGKIPGLKGEVDVDVFFLSASALEKFGKP